MNINFNVNNLKKTLKRTGITICTGSLLGIASFKTYDLYINNKLKRIEFSDDDINNIKEYYQDEDIVIFTMNDSQGINLNIGFWKNSYQGYLKEELNAEIIDTSSLLYNKTSHIDMTLTNNLSIEDIKRLNNKGAYVAFRKVAADNNMELLESLFGNIGEKVFGKEIVQDDANTYITDLLISTKEPIIIYSSGANNLMYEANFNPNSEYIDEYGNISKNYLYAKEKLQDNETINKVISGIEENFQHILSINPDCKIFVLSIYIPNSLQDDRYDEFKNTIKEYNKKLEELCKKYNINFINEEQLGYLYNENKYNFHIDEIGHKELASLLITEISNNLDEEPISVQKEYLYEKNGLVGYYQDLLKEISSIDKPSNKSYSIEAYNQHLKEKKIEAKVCKELLKK